MFWHWHVPPYQAKPVLARRIMPNPAMPAIHCLAQSYRTSTRPVMPASPKHAWTFRYLPRLAPHRHACRVFAPPRTAGPRLYIPRLPCRALPDTEPPGLAIEAPPCLPCFISPELAPSHPNVPYLACPVFVLPCLCAPLADSP